MAKAKSQSPVVEQVINAYADALAQKDVGSEELRGRLVAIMLDDAAPTSKRIEEALFPPPKEEGEP